MKGKNATLLGSCNGTHPNKQTSSDTAMTNIYICKEISQKLAYKIYIHKSKNDWA